MVLKGKEKLGISNRLRLALVILILTSGVVTYYYFSGQVLPYSFKSGILIAVLVLLVLFSTSRAKRINWESASTVTKQTHTHEQESPFLLPIDYVFTISWQGVVVIGIVESGTIKKGDAVEIVGTKGTKKVKCIGVTADTILLQQAQAQDTVGILLKGATEEEVKSGKVLAKPGTITPEEVERRLTSKKMGVVTRADEV